MKLPVKYDSLNGSRKKKVRNQYIEEQDYKCFYCKTSLNLEPPHWITVKKIDLTLFPPGFLKSPIHLQHDHQTGLTEGAVHAYCNAVMWQYEGR